MRDHGGNIDAAIQTYGGAAADWIDLSTGINRAPYPVPPLSAAAWTGLPTRAAIASLHDVARTAWGITGAVLAVSGAQTAIQLIPRLSAPAQARVLAPTYNEHAASLRAAGWQVTEVATLADLAGADLAVVVNPNNPDGTRYAPQTLLDLLHDAARLVAEQAAGRQQAFELARHRLAGVEQGDAGRHAPGDGLGHPRIVRTAQGHHICRGRRQRTGKNRCPTA